MGGDDSALLPLATAYHDLGRAADRDAALSRHLDLFGETPGALRLLAERDAAEGRYEEAREKLVAWTERTERQDADAWVLLAELHDRAGEPDAALAALRRARELFPGDVSPRGALPRLLARLPAPEESEEARALLAELCRIDEEAVEPRLVLARLHADEDDDERAIAYYREAVEIDPYLPEARAALAALLAGAGRDDLASAQWQLVLGMRADQVNVSGERFAELREEAARAVRDGP